MDFTKELIEDHRERISKKQLPWSTCVQKLYPAALDEIERLQERLQIMRKADPYDFEWMEKHEAEVAELKAHLKATQELVDRLYFTSGALTAKVAPEPVRA